VNEDRVILFYPQKNYYMGQFIVSLVLCAVGIWIFFLPRDGNIFSIVGVGIAFFLRNLYVVWKQRQKHSRAVAIRPMVISALFILLLIAGFVLHERYGGGAAQIALGVCCVTLFGLSAIHLVSAILSGKPSIVMDETGIVDRSSLVGAGRLSWSEIEGFETYEYLNNRYIGIWITEESARRFSPLRRMLFYRKNLLSISARSVSVPVDEFMRIVTELWNDKRERH
jgi:hypothetical protein